MKKDSTNTKSSPFRQKAVALKYNPETDDAPKVLAKGVGQVAERIIEKAEGIEVIEDAALVEDLTRLDIGDNIPPELYEVVAQILVFISELDKTERANKPKQLRPQLQPRLSRQHQPNNLTGEYV